MTSLIGFEHLHVDYDFSILDAYAVQNAEGVQDLTTPDSSEFLQGSKHATKTSSDGI